MTTDSRILQAPQIPTNIATESPRTATSRRLRLGRRHLWLIPGLVIAVYANAQSAQHGLGLAVLLVFGIVPHLPALLGIGQPHARGQMALRAVPLFNAMHHPAPPLSPRRSCGRGRLVPLSVRRRSSVVLAHRGGPSVW